MMDSQYLNGECQEAQICCYNFFLDRFIDLGLVFDIG